MANKLKLIPGRLYCLGDHAEICKLVNNAEISITIPPNSVLMYI